MPLRNDLGGIKPLIAQYALLRAYPGGTMVAYVLNIRMSQLDEASSTLHLPRFSLKAALDAAGHEILLFAARDEQHPGYYGTAIMGDPMPDLSDRSRYRLPLYGMRHLTRVITLTELRALGIGEMPFHTYSHPVRTIGEEDQRGLIALGAIPEGFGEQAHEPFDHTPPYLDRLAQGNFRQLRFEMYDTYQLACAFTRKAYRSLDGNRYGFDVGHIWPRSAGGPNIIQNVLPMSKDVNNQWDEGVISLTNVGDLLIAKNANDDTRALFSDFNRIVFPRNPQLWPDTQYLERHRDEIFEKGPQWLHPVNT